MKDWIALNMTPGVGPRVTARLLEHFGSAEAIFDAPRRELALLRLTPEAIESIASRELFERAEREIENIRKLGGDILVLDDGVYPSLLREIYDPPIVLYVKGAWAECLEQPCVAIVGSRRCSTYGQNAALMLARDLAQRGVTIVSGFARGIDAAAHRGALEAGGRTVAVLGTGIDRGLSSRSQEAGEWRFWNAAARWLRSFRWARRRSRKTFRIATASLAD